MQTLEVHEEEAAERRKADSKALGTIGTSFAISRIARLKRDSWVKVNGIELSTTHTPAESRLRADTPTCNITVLWKFGMHCRFDSKVWLSEHSSKKVLVLT